MKYVEKLPHLRLAYAALQLIDEDTDLKAGNVAAFEAWFSDKPAVMQNLGSAREFLKALCPLRYKHSDVSHDARKVIEMFPKVVAMLPAANTKLPSKVFLNPRLNPNLTDNGKKLTNLLSERMENCVKNDSDFAFADDAATCDILLGFSVCYGKETFVNVVFPSRVEELVKAMKLGDNVAYSELSDSINSVIPFVNLEVVVKNNTKKEEIESYLSSLARGVFDCL